jgi:hypothetical protein
VTEPDLVTRLESRGSIHIRCDQPAQPVAVLALSPGASLRRILLAAWKPARELAQHRAWGELLVEPLRR